MDHPRVVHFFYLKTVNFRASQRYCLAMVRSENSPYLSFHELVEL